MPENENTQFIPEVETHIEQAVMALLQCFTKVNEELRVSLRDSIQEAFYAYHDDVVVPERSELQCKKQEVEDLRAQLDKQRDYYEMQERQNRYERIIDALLEDI